jgi:hypothetical protein
VSHHARSHNSLIIEHIHPLKRSPNVSKDPSPHPRAASQGGALRSLVKFLPAQKKGSDAAYPKRTVEL